MTTRDWTKIAGVVLAALAAVLLVLLVLNPSGVWLEVAKELLNILGLVTVAAVLKLLVESHTEERERREAVALQERQRLEALRARRLKALNDLTHGYFR